MLSHSWARKHFKTEEIPIRNSDRKEPYITLTLENSFYHEFYGKVHSTAGGGKEKAVVEDEADKMSL